jgi:hypothetical protein
LALAGCGRAPPPLAKWVIGADATHIRCVNLASGASWTIAFDPAGRLADGQPASFGDRRIAWRDLKQGSVFELDRASGALVVTRASSTGGYVSTYACSD